MSWRGSWSTQCPVYRMPSERETVWNRLCAGVGFLCVNSPNENTIEIERSIAVSVSSTMFIPSCFRRENEHDQVVRSIYEDMESQLREEKQKQHAQVHS